MSQGVVPAFPVVRFARAPADATVRFFLEVQCIGIPEIAETMTGFVGIRTAAKVGNTFAHGDLQ